MKAFRSPVREHMNPTVFTIGRGASLEEADLEMSRQMVSGLVVVDDRDSPVGVISRTDLLRAGRAIHAPDGGGSVNLNERLVVDDLFHSDPVSIGADATLEEAARLMGKRHVHRLMVEQDARPVGMLSVTDLLRTVASSAADTPVSELASESIAHVAPDDTVAHAMDRLTAAGVRGLVVMQDGWPVGALTQQEALAAQQAGGDARVEDWMSPAVVCIPESTPLHRACAQAVAMHAPLMVTLQDQKPRGVLTPTDLIFAIM
jgi:CBS domain-containing protein